LRRIYRTKYEDTGPEDTKLFLIGQGCCLFRLLDKGIWYLQFTWQPYVYMYPTTPTKEDIMDNHRSVFVFLLESQPKMKNWIFRHSNEYLNYTSPLSKLLTSFYRRFKNCKVQSRFLSSCKTINTFDFSNLYTTIPHSKLKTIGALCL